VRDRGLFYHLPAWIEGLGACFHYRVHWLCARAGDTLTGVLPLAEVPGLLSRRRLVSLPFSYAAGPVAEDSGTAAALMLDAVSLAGTAGLGRVEIKRLGDALPGVPGFQRGGRYATYRVDTSAGEAAVWNRLNADSTRRGIRRAEKAGVVVAQGGGEGDWEAFARLEEGTARAHGLPAPPREFFVRFAAGLARDGRAALYLARLADGRVAAGTVIWKGPREWIYGFNASDARLLRDRPNHALLWSAMRDAIAAGVIFDLGRAADDQETLAAYKRRWGGQPVRLAYDYWPAAAGLNVARRDRGPLVLAAAVWRRLPRPVARLGSRLYRYLG
jgi:hypothetical protein